MATKADVRAILKSGKLTGREAARIVVQHYVDQDHKRGALLTASEIERIKKAVARRPAEEVGLYNAILEAYRLSEYTLREAHILALDILLHLEWAKADVRQVTMAWLLRLEQHKRPTIVTAKQFEDLKARARARKLQELHCLNQVIAYRAGERAEPGHCYTGCEGLSDEEFDTAFRQAGQEIAALIAKGKLQPVETDFRADDDQLRRLVHPTPLPGGETVHWWPEGEHCWSSNTPEEERDRQLRTYVSGEQLYQAGLPEWVREVDTYQHELESEVQCLPEAERGPCVAVIQEPVEWPVELDKQGYYQTRDLVELSGITGLEQLLHEDGRDLKQHLRDQHKWLRANIRVFLAHRPVLETLSDLVGVKLHEDLETWQAQIEQSATPYTALLSLPFLEAIPEDQRRWWEPEWLARKPELPSFTIGDLKPDPKRVRQLQERMALPLGDTWWKWLVEEEELVITEEERLAEEVARNGQG
jgi:hypothetical protein